MGNYSEIVAVVVGVVFGFVLSETKEACHRRQRRKARFGALRAEIELCRETAQTYLASDKKIPLYRLPTNTYENSLPALLADGVLKEKEVSGLTEFFAQVETLNRELNQAQEMREKGEQQLLSEEISRNIVKAKRLVPVEERSPSFYDRARRIVDDHL
jgi:hypothetical protein